MILFRRKKRASLILRLNSVEATRSRGSLANRSDHSAPMATMCIGRIRKFVKAILIKVHCTHSAKNVALRMISLDFSIFLEANSVSPRQSFFSI